VKNQALIPYQDFAIRPSGAMTNTSFTATAELAGGHSYRGCVNPHSFHSFSQTQIP
jgi:hypothetical protein